MNGQNLDRLCAQYGWQMAKEVCRALGKNAENHITKSLGVLQEDGVYAFFLYQVSRGESEKQGAEKLKKQVKELLRAVPIKPFEEIDDPLEAVRGNDTVKGLADDLDDLLLAKRLMELALIYARYHVKALEG